MLYFTVHAFGRRSMIFWAAMGRAVAALLLAAAPCLAGEGPQHVIDSKHDARLPNESKIAAALNERTEMDFAEQPLSDVFDYLKQRHEIEIQIDVQALSDAGMGTDTPITRSIKGITLESALDLILSQLDLTWVIHDEVLFVTTKVQAGKMVETRVYPVRDLLPPAADEELPGADEADYASLVECLEEAAGAEDVTQESPAIHVFPPAYSLVVVRPIRMHYRIEKLLKELRAAKSEASR
ncbi:MAG TPA: hypothetical protein VFI31_06370 [Pirellulales bacterium]|nr:hypothetical protein [Pirellulales bacterium]